MDIERLRELQQKVSDIIFNALSKLTDKNTMEITLGFGEDLQTLIDEAIARQSVKSEEVQEAIGFIQGGYGDVWKWSKKRREIIIAALQEYQPWIPVGERLPKNSEHDWVLAQITEDNGYMWIPKVVEYREGIGDWYCEELGWLKTHNGTFKVTHWKPLPEPPKGE